jgi:hypothetical protein
MKEKLKTTTPRKTGGVKLKTVFGYTVSNIEKAIIEAEFSQQLDTVAERLQWMAGSSAYVCFDDDDEVTGARVDLSPNEIKAEIEKAFAYFEKYLSHGTWERKNKTKKTEVNKNVKKK